MEEAERGWAIAAGVAGVVCLVAGSLLSALPPVDRPWPERVAALASRRGRILAGSVLTATAGALLIWPVAAVVVAGEVWPSLRLTALGLAVLSAAVLMLVATLVATVAWRAPDDDPAARLFLDAAHLALWSVSAPLGALTVVVVTAAGVQADLFGWLVVVVAAAKVATVVLEVGRTGARTGWSAGGWAAGSSGYVTVLWYGLILVALA